MAKKSLIFESLFETYTSSGIIGEGGSGYVHSVASSAGDIFALKYLNPDRITSEKLKRFKNEIEFCQRNNHPNIVRLIDTGVILVKDTKCPFYVMKHYSGTLRACMQKLSKENALQMFSQILNGVEARIL